MIISLVEAKKIDPDITQDDLNAFEVAIRELTNNNFQNRFIRFENITVVSENLIGVGKNPVGLRAGDTIELNYSEFNDGLYVIESIEGNLITLDDGDLIVATVNGSIITKIEYPADIARGVKKLIRYDVKMGDKIGIKSESISRMSTTYYDVNKTESTEGYPATLLTFIDKYMKMRW